ncbi:MAG: agmatinase [Desulfobacterales bacterium]|nr:agmatinase [Desulfobacterales bacterium]
MKEKYPDFLNSEIIPPPPEEAYFHVISAPYEKSVSYGTGTAEGPSAILQASLQLEVFDGYSIPAEQGIYTHPPLDCEGPPEIILQKISNCFSQVLKLGKIPIMLGGEHTVTLGALQALKQHYGDFGVVQLDAHADLRNTYEGNSFSHACVMHRALDLGLSIYQIGVRSLSYEEHCLRCRQKIGHLDANSIAAHGVPDEILPQDFPENIYLTIDVDSLDPSIIPATGTPEPGGLSWYQTLQVLESVLHHRNILGFDVVELSPIPGMHAPNFAVARLIYNLMGIIARNKFV